MPSQHKQAKPNGAAAPDLSWLETSGAAAGAHQPDVVEHLVPAGSLTRFYGRQNTGKTMGTASLAFHVAAMPTWCGRKVENGFAFYVNPHGALHDHFAALAEHHEVELGPQVPLRAWASKVVNVDDVIDALKVHAQKLGPCKLAVVNFNRGTVDPEVLFKLVQELHEDVRSAVVVTMPDPPPQLPFGFDGSWQAVRVVEQAACLVRVESIRGRPARTRLDFNITIVGEAEHARSIVTHTSHRYHAFPIGWRDQHSLVLEALIMHVSLNGGGGDCLLTIEDFAAVALASPAGAAMRGQPPSRKKATVTRWWHMFHRHAILAAHPFIEGRSFLTTLWRGYVVFGHMHATAEVFAKAMAGLEERVEH